MTEIDGIALGEARVYLMKDQKGCVLVDAGSKGKEQEFSDRLDKLRILPNNINLIVITHVHYDMLAAWLA
jgi:glyoxylase-like metal-dependent hydrolase (beta-lactamase superfamily II)